MWMLLRITLKPGVECPQLPNPVTSTIGFKVLQNSALEALGFRFGTNGPHAARTMMLEELRLLMTHVDSQSERLDYASAIVEKNALCNPPLPLA